MKAFDLTLLGIDNLTTVAEVEAWLAQNVGTKEYYAYDAGSLLSFNPSDLQTVGFNQYDNSKQTANVHVLADQKYRIKGTYSGLAYSDGTAVTVEDGYFTPDRVDYLTLSGGNNVDTCVHLSWSGYRDGGEDYEAYWSVDTDLSWIKALEYNGSPLFPNGLCKAGDVYDEISDGKAIKRIGSVDMGTLNWGYNTTGNYPYFYAELTPTCKVGAANNVANAICSKYPMTSWNNRGDKTAQIFYATVRGINIIDYAYTDAATFKAAMNGVMLNYELATPIVVDLPSGLNLNYRMDDFGTEELINTEVAANVPGLCAPTEIHIEYQDNLRDKIRRLDDNYVSLNPQENSESKKLQARENIGAAATSGSYPELLAGNLVGQTVDRDTYLIRPTGNGGEDVASGTASVIGMEGNSCVWNQLISTPYNFSGWAGNTAANTSDGKLQTWTITAITDQSTRVSKYIDLKPMQASLFNHKIYASVTVYGSDFNRVLLHVSRDTQSGQDNNKTFNNLINDSWNKLSFIGTYVYNGDSASGFVLDIYTNNAMNIGDTFQVKDVEYIDLTRLGIDNLTTVSQVEEWLANNVGPKEYYAYNAGTILSSKTLGMKTYGQNLLNPETKKATLIPYSWEVNSNVYTIKNVPSGATATFTPDNTSGAETVDVSGGSLDITSYGSGVLELSDATASTYVCMKWDGRKDDDVVPYEEHTYGFDITKVYGKVNGAGEYVQCYPNGMKSAGSVHDTLTANEAVVNVGKFVFPASPSQVQAAYAFYSKPSNMRVSLFQGYLLSIGLKKIQSGIASSLFSFSESETSINVNIDGVGSNVANAMNGQVMLYYLKSPITYTNLIYSEDEGATGTPLSDVLLNINVNNWSMEEQLLPAYADGNPTSVPATVSTIYGLNAVEAIDKLQKTTYTESEIHSNLASLLSCINTNCSTVLGGTFSVSDTATEKVFSFTFTPNE